MPSPTAWRVSTRAAWAELRAYFRRYDALRNCDVRLTGTPGACTGRARGVDDVGRLGVETATGLRWFDAADVQLETP